MDLRHGIYAVSVSFDGRRAHGAAYLGPRPTFDAGEPAVEVFLLDFDGDLYGKTIEIEVIAFLRGDEAFASEAALKAQMAKDCERARAVLAEIEADDPMRAFPLGRALG
jgi:riboflavin kinase/FMN adenylyltransferase